MYVERQSETEIAVERALVEFVKDDSRNTGQFGIVEDHARQHALGDDQYPGFRRSAVFHAHGIADSGARFLIKQLGHAARGGAGGEPARLEQNDLAGTQPGRIEQRQRHTSVVLPAPGGADQHRAGAGGKRFAPRAGRISVTGSARQGVGDRPAS